MQGVVEKIIDQLSDSLSDVTESVLRAQATNAPQDAGFPQRATAFTRVAEVLGTVAHQTAQAFAAFPVVMGDINVQADVVAHASAALVPPFQAIVTAADRHGAYAAILNSLKVLVQATTLLLVLVYGARSKVLRLLADKALMELQTMRHACASDHAGLGPAVSTVTSTLAALAQQAAAQAADVTDAAEKASLAALAQALQNTRQPLVDVANGVLQHPGDAAAGNAANAQIDASTAIIQDLLRAVEPRAGLDAMRIMEDKLRAGAAKHAAAAAAPAPAPAPVALIDAAAHGANADSISASLATLGGLGSIPGLDLSGLLSSAALLAQGLNGLVGDLPVLSPPQVDAAVGAVAPKKDAFVAAATAVAASPKVPELLRDVTSGHRDAIASASDALSAASTAFAANRSAATAAAVHTAETEFAEAYAAFAADMQSAVADAGKAPAAAAAAAGTRPADPSDKSAAGQVNTIASELRGHSGLYAGGALGAEPAVLEGIELSDLMARLSECARNGDRIGIVAVSKAIQALSKKMAAEAKALAGSTTKADLKADLMSASKAIADFGTQLKIIGSVVASSDGVDASSQDQLISCCKGLAKAVRVNMDTVAQLKLRH